VYFSDSTQVEAAVAGVDGVAAVFCSPVVVASSVRQAVNGSVDETGSVILKPHPVLLAANDTLDSHGFGMSSVRFICGTQDIHKQLEKNIVDFHGKQDAIIYPSGFDANSGFFEAVLTP
jgi:hypothetical protein